MEKIRVLVVDDSLVVRRVVTEELAAQADIEVAGSASTGGSRSTKWPSSIPIWSFSISKCRRWTG